MTTHLQGKPVQSENFDEMLARLIVLTLGNSQVFLSRSADGYVLPEVQVPKWERFAPRRSPEILRASFLPSPFLG
jgi:hypothetical protein